MDQLMNGPTLTDIYSAIFRVGDIIEDRFRSGKQHYMVIDTLFTSNRGPWSLSSVQISAIGVKGHSHVLEKQRFGLFISRREKIMKLL